MPWHTAIEAVDGLALCATNFGVFGDELQVVQLARGAFVLGAPVKSFVLLIDTGTHTLLQFGDLVWSEKVCEHLEVPGTATIVAANTAKICGLVLALIIDT